MIELNKNTAHLKNGKISYVLEVDEHGNLVHRHFGKPIRNYNGSGKTQDYWRGFAPVNGDVKFSYETYPFEYPVRSHGDFRIPALSVKQENGMEDLTLKFKDWEVLDKKPEIPGLPSTTSDDSSETLKITLEDKTAGLEVDCFYTIFEDLGIITRFQEIKNIGKQTLEITNIQSASLELPHQDLEMLTLYGVHCKEANKNRFPLHHGIQRIDSVRGVSSHHAQPFMALMTPETNYDTGKVYALNLVYSGNFNAQTEVDSYKNTRAQIGINSETFNWVLKPGESFFTPEAILNFSDQGLGGMAENFHKLYTDHLIPKEFINEPRPLLFNSWEGTYFDVSQEKIEKQAQIIKDLGLELYVLDDGWFRNDSKEGMGDWEALPDKLPGGIDGVAKIVHDKGLKFGLWFEPEAVGEISKVLKEHPDWALQLPGYIPTTSRHEFLLDLTREDVRDHLVVVLSKYLSKGNIDYIKWDMNRPITDYFSLLADKENQGEIAHRYVLGLYDILSRLREQFPNVLIEGCASGGGRFDPGMLYFVPQNWTSDNTDAFDRTLIQEGTSLLYPPVTMGAHVSVSPNHQTGRESSLQTRFDVARLFNLGYEIDVTQLDQDELDEIKEQIKEYKEDRDWLQKGNFYQNTIDDENFKMWSIVSPEKDKAMAVIFQDRFNPLSAYNRFKFKGLEPEGSYRIKSTDEVFNGDELMEIGIAVPLKYSDYATTVLKLEKIK